MAAREVEHLSYLGLGNLICIDPAEPDTFLMHMKHDPGRLFTRTIEKPLENEHDEFHRRVIVVQQQDAVKRGFLGADTGFRGQIEAGAIALAGHTAARSAATGGAGRRRARQGAQAFTTRAGSSRRMWRSAMSSFPSL